MLRTLLGARNRLIFSVVPIADARHFCRDAPGGW
jgi:hypothetical protein